MTPSPATPTLQPKSQQQQRKRRRKIKDETETAKRRCLPNLCPSKAEDEKEKSETCNNCDGENKNRSRINRRKAKTTDKN